MSLPWSKGLFTAPQLAAGSAHPPVSAQGLLQPAVGHSSSWLLLFEFSLFNQPFLLLIVAMAAFPPTACPVSCLVLVSSCVQAEAYRSWIPTVHLGLWASPFSVCLLSTCCHLFCTLDCLWSSGSFSFCYST